MYIHSVWRCPERTSARHPVCSRAATNSANTVALNRARELNWPDQYDKYVRTSRNDVYSPDRETILAERKRIENELNTADVGKTLEEVMERHAVTEAVDIMIRQEMEAAQTQAAS